MHRTMRQFASEVSSVEGTRTLNIVQFERLATLTYFVYYAMLYRVINVVSRLPRIPHDGSDPSLPLRESDDLATSRMGQMRSGTGLQPHEIAAFYLGFLSL